jgi:hypothetical protein
MPTASPISPVSDFDLADFLVPVANTLHGYRVQHDATLSGEEWDSLRNAEHMLMDNIVALRAAGVGELAEMAEGARQQLGEALGSMNAFLADLHSVQMAIGIAAAAAGLAAAVLAGNVDGMIAASGELASASQSV